MKIKNKRLLFPSIGTVFVECVLLVILIGGFFFFGDTVALLFEPDQPVLGILICAFGATGIAFAEVLILLSAAWYYMVYCRVVTISRLGVQIGLCKRGFLSWGQISGFGIGKILPENKKAKQLFIYLYKGALNHSTVARYGISDIWMMSHLKRRTDQGKPIRKMLLSRTEDLPISEIKTMPEHIVWIRYSQDLYDIVSTQCQRGDGSG